MADAKLTYGTPRVVLELSMDEAAALEAVLYRTDFSVNNEVAAEVYDVINAIWDKLDDVKATDAGKDRHWPTDIEEFRDGPYFLID